jgi:hypothetical protein
MMNNKFHEKRTASPDTSLINNIMTIPSTDIKPTTKKLLSHKILDFEKNHAIHFDKYSERKSIFDCPNSFPIVTYLEPVNHGSNPKGVSFAKMPKRNLDIEVNNYPSVGYYKPNIEIIKKKSSRNIKLGSSERNLDKKFLLQKLWRSYDVGTDYKLVAFNENIEKKK